MAGTTAADKGKHQDAPRTSGQDLDDIVRGLWQIPRRWVALMIGAAILTSVTVSRTAEGKTGLEISVGTLAITSLALIWLPALLRILFLTGGSLKAGGVEASAAGLFTREDLMDFLVRAKAVTRRPEGEAPGEVALAELDAAVDRLAHNVFDSTHSLSSNALKSLALEYERLRRDTTPGPQRTSAMTRIVNEARVRGASSVTRAASLAGQLLRSRSQGERIVGLALAQEAPSPQSFREILELVQNSATAFEMFHALLALQEVAAFLGEDQRQQAFRALVHESDDPRNVGIHDDPGLPALLARTIKELQTHSRSR